MTKLHNKVASLNSTLKRSKTDLANQKRLLKVEKEKVKSIQLYDNKEYELQMNDMEQKIKEYQDIGTMQNRFLNLDTFFHLSCI